jgi:S-adenosylmethionine hydrolase
MVFVAGNLRVAGPAPNYSRARPGDFVALVNSWGLLEIAVYLGNAQQLSGKKIGDRVSLVAID